MDHARRLGQLRRRMTKAGLTGLLVTHLIDIRYLVGFTGSSAALAITGRTARLFTDGRYTAQAAQQVKGAQVEIVSGPPSVSAVQWLAAQPRSTTAGFDPTHTFVSELTRLRSELPSKLRRTFLTPLAAPLVEPLRLIKDDDELAIIRENALIGCRLFDHILTVLRPGIPEIEIAAELEYQARLHGAEGMSFETIVASGERSALPHGKASTSPLPRKGFVTLDFGIIREGYCSDMTRTVCLGMPRSEERKAYETVLDAQEAAVAAVAAGVGCAEVDEAARSILRTAGMADAFSHSTGHGVGLEIHEQPRLGAGQKTRLEAGMVVTIEPGVYWPGKFGLRIEDMVAVTRTGGQVLTPAPKALIQL